MQEQAIKEGTSNILRKLREETGFMHRKLEQTALSRSLLDPAIKTGQYFKYLLAMEKVIAFTEKSVYPKLSSVIPDLSSRSKAGILSRDLDWLGKFVPAPDLDAIYPAAPGDILNTGFALGFMYVIEGSTLGGLYILKQLPESLGIRENEGGSYFYGYGKETHKRWNDFLKTLSDYAEKTGDLNEMVNGAVFAFATIHDFFETIEL